MSECLLVGGSGRKEWRLSLSFPCSSLKENPGYAKENRHKKEAFPVEGFP